MPVQGCTLPFYQICSTQATVITTLTLIVIFTVIRSSSGNKENAIPGLFCPYGCWSLHIFLHLPVGMRVSLTFNKLHVYVHLHIQSRAISLLIALTHLPVSFVLEPYKAYPANDSFVSPQLFFHAVLVKSNSHTHTGVLVPPLSGTYRHYPVQFQQRFLITCFKCSSHTHTHTEAFVTNNIHHLHLHTTHYIPSSR